MKTYFLLIPILLITACKTREQIAREKLVDDIANQLKDGQELQSDSLTKIQSLEEQIALANGKVEEASQENKSKIEQLQSQVNQLEIQLQENDEKLSEMSDQLTQQEAYIKKVLTTLESMSGKKAPKRKSTPFETAMRYYKSGKYDKARPIFISLLKQKQTENRKKRLLHNLGIVEYLTKNYNDALTYLSRLYTEYPKSAYNKNGLLHLGKTFQAMKKNDEAKETYKMLIKNFPTSKHAKEAGDLLKKI
jgi:TolA-binding protein